MELEQRRGLDQNAELRYPVPRHEQHGQAEHESIKSKEIGRPSPGTVADEQLVFQEQRLGGDGTDATGAEQFRGSYQQMDNEDQEFAHGAKLPRRPASSKLQRIYESLILRIRHPQDRSSLRCEPAMTDDPDELRAEIEARRRDGPSTRDVLGEVEIRLR